MSQNFNSTMSWNVGRSGARCAACGVMLEPGKICWAALVEGPVGGTAGAASGTEAPAAETEPATKEGKGGEEGTRPGAVVYERRDFCEGCWGQGKRPEAPQVMFSFWKTSVPLPTQKKKLLVDDSVLMDLFARLEDKSALQDVQFRFVLALILMRKRLLKYERTEPLPEAEATALMAPTPTVTETAGTAGEAGAETPAGAEGNTPPAEAPAMEESAGAAATEPVAGQPAAAEPARAAAPSEPPEVWIMTPRGSEESVRVINPQLTPEQISGVSGQLSQILAEEI